ncbi:MAG: flagellar basal body rod protein FlgC [Bacillota bacterium]
MPLFESFGISASALTANRLWLDLISNNIANMHTAGRPGDPAAPPYRRKVPIFAQQLHRMFNSGNKDFPGQGVRVRAVIEDPAAPRMAYEPDHPLADPVTGYVAYPNINLANEMINAVVATRAYEASVTALNAAKDMALKALEIGRG